MSSHSSCPLQVIVGCCKLRWLLEKMACGGTVYDKELGRRLQFVPGGGLSEGLFDNCCILLLASGLSFIMLIGECGTGVLPKALLS